MKVLYIITKSAEIGGAQIHVRDLSYKLKQIGDRPVVITGEDGQLNDELRANGIEVHVVKELIREIKLVKDLVAIIKIAYLIYKIKPDVVSLHSSKAGFIGRLACALNFKKPIFTAHGWSFADGISERKRKVYVSIEKMLSKITRKIITVSQQDKDLAIKYNVASNEKQIAIHNGMPEYNLCSDFSRDTSDGIRFVTVARYTSQKDHYTLFKALDSLPSNIRWSLDLIGTGPLEDSIKRLALNIKHPERINFLGQVSNVSERLFYYDVFLLISNWEGFPRSILEAMRTGLPVLASDVGGVSESVIDGKGGFLIKRGDSIDLADKLVKIASNTTLIEEMGTFNKERFDNNFTFDSMFRKTYKVYLESLNGSKLEPSKLEEF